MEREQTENIPLDRSEKLSKIDKFNLVLGLFNFIAVLVIIGISIWSTKKSEAIAEKSGAFDKGELHLSFGGYFINPNDEFDVYYGVNFSDSTLHFATLPLGIHNRGKKTLDNVNLLLKYPHLANIAVKDSFIKFDAVFTDPIERKFITVEPFDQVSYKFISINPNFSISAGDLICLRKETIGRETFPVKTKDSIEINFSTIFSYAYPIKIGLTAKDIRSEQYNFILSYRAESDVNKLVWAVIKEKRNSKDNEKNLRDFFIVIPKADKIVGDGKHRITFMNSDATNTLFCQFDKTKQYIVIMNQDGTIQQQIKL